MPKRRRGVRSHGRLRGGDAARGLLLPLQRVLVQRHGARLPPLSVGGGESASLRSRSGHNLEAGVLRALRQAEAPEAHALQLPCL